MIPIATAMAAQGTLSEMAMGVSAWSAVGSLIAILVSAIAVLLLVVRKGDMRVIESATSSLNRLVETVGEFRGDLAAIREWIAREYATKGDLRDVWAQMKELDHKIDRTRDHFIERGPERRANRDSDG